MGWSVRLGLNVLLTWLCKRQLNVFRLQIKTIKIAIIRSMIWCESITSLRCGPLILCLMYLVIMDSCLSRQEQAIIITIPFLPLMPAHGEFVWMDIVAIQRSSKHFEVSASKSCLTLVKFSQKKTFINNPKKSDKMLQKQFYSNKSCW